MLHKSLLILSLAAACSVAHAQASAPASPSTPAKKELVARIIKLQQPGIEAMARNLAERPAAELLANASPVLASRVAPDKQEAVAREIQADAKKYADETVPLVRDRALKLAPTTIGAVLEEKFTEDELKQVLAMMESPVFNKFQSLGGDMQRALAEKLVADTRGSVEQKLKALEETVGKRLGVNAQAGAAQSGNKAPAKK